MDDMGLLDGSMKFAGAGGNDAVVLLFGMEKSSISLFNMIPVLGDMNTDPK